MESRDDQTTTPKPDGKSKTPSAPSMKVVPLYRLPEEVWVGLEESESKEAASAPSPSESPAVISEEATADSSDLSLLG
jgi:hypothetical protein